MTQNEKDLLLKDLSARLNTNLVCSIYRIDDYGVGYRDEILTGYCKGDIWYEFYFGDNCSICIDNVSKIKPYLFPLSSMTKEQEKEFNQLLELELKAISDEIDHTQVTAFEIDFYNKHHFDWRGLIEKGLAIDATNLNIY